MLGVCCLPDARHCPAHPPHTTRPGRPAALADPRVHDAAHPLPDPHTVPPACQACGCARLHSSAAPPPRGTPRTPEHPTLALPEWWRRVGEKCCSCWLWCVIDNNLRSRRCVLALWGTLQPCRRAPLYMCPGMRARSAIPTTPCRHRPDLAPCQPRPGEGHGARGGDYLSHCPPPSRHHRASLLQYASSVMAFFS